MLEVPLTDANRGFGGGSPGAEGHRDGGYLDNVNMQECGRETSLLICSAPLGRARYPRYRRGRHACCIFLEELGGPSIGSQQGFKRREVKLDKLLRQASAEVEAHDDSHGEFL